MTSPKEEAPRLECHVLYRGRWKCGLPRGHDGNHRGGGFSWENHCANPEAPRPETCECHANGAGGPYPKNRHAADCHWRCDQEADALRADLAQAHERLRGLRDMAEEWRKATVEAEVLKRQAEKTRLEGAARELGLGWKNNALRTEVEALKRRVEHREAEHATRRGECLAAQMIEAAAQTRAEAAEARYRAARKAWKRLRAFALSVVKIKDDVNLWALRAEKRAEAAEARCKRLEKEAKNE